MRKVLFTLVAALGMALAFPAGATADHAGDWSANGESFVVNETTVHLEGADTSVETGNLGITVDEGVTVTAEYELVDGAECRAGEPRIFAGINGAHPQHNKSAQCDGDGEDGPAGTLSFTTDRAGLMAWFGLVYSPGEADAGHVVIRDLTVDGEPVHFTNPEPEPEVIDLTEPVATDATCEASGTLDLAADAGVEWSIGNEAAQADTVEVEPGDYTVQTSSLDGFVFDDELYPEGDPVFNLTVEAATGCQTETPEPEPTQTDDATPVPTSVPAGSETLPDTGVSLLWLAGGAMVLILAGTGLILSRRHD